MTFPHGSNLEIRTTALFGGKKGGCVLQLLWKGAHISARAAIGGCELPWCLAELESLASPKVTYLVHSSLSFICMASA